MDKHPWQSMDIETDEGKSVRELVREIDEEVTRSPNFYLTNFLRRIEEDRPVVESWETTEHNFLMANIPFEKMTAYNSAMGDIMPGLSFPYLIQIIRQWQSHLYVERRPMGFHPAGDKESLEWSKQLLGHHEAVKQCPDLKATLLPGYVTIRMTFEEAKERYDSTMQQLNEFMWEQWGGEKVDAFRIGMTSKFSGCDMDLHQAILAIQYDFCKEALAEAGQGF